jgi:hypothetical protein
MGSWCSGSSTPRGTTVGEETSAVLAAAGISLTS